MAHKKQNAVDASANVSEQRVPRSQTKQLAVALPLPELPGFIKNGKGGNPRCKA
jgi:hypothetical protein